MVYLRVDGKIFPEPRRLQYLHGLVEDLFSRGKDYSRPHALLSTHGESQLAGCNYLYSLTQQYFLSGSVFRES